MSTQAKLCQRLIDAGRISGMAEKLDQLMMYDRISVEEYNALMAQLNNQTA